MIELKMPSLGEGAKPGTVLSLLVKPGDTVAVDQPLLEIEAEKATIELPSTHAGQVKEIKVKAGDTVETDSVLMTLEEGAGQGEKKAEKKAEAKPEKAEAKPEQAEAKPHKAEQKAEKKPEPVHAAARGGDGNGSRSVDGGTLPAGPAVRRLARLLGVDLARVHGGGERGRIRPEDVHSYLEQLKSGTGGGGGGFATPPLPDFSRWGEVTSEPVSGVRRATAEAMARAWALIPHVTNHDLVDVTELEAARKEWVKSHPDAPKLTLTVPLLKAVVAALKKFPKFNATLDLAGGRVIQKGYYNLGVAVDTPAGLLVPVVKDADKKPLLQLAQELNDVAARARERKIGLDEMKGGTFTISNLGGIGGYGFTPIINWPEVAILGVSRAREEYRPGPDGAPTLRLIMPLSLSYDHRLIDGAEAARFLRFLNELLGSPAALLFAL